MLNDEKGTSVEYDHEKLDWEIKYKEKKAIQTSACLLIMKIR